VSFWSWLTGVNHEGEVANANPSSSVGPESYNPGDPHGVVLEESDVELEGRSLPTFFPTPWSGWPSSWGTPDWDFGSRFNELVDVAWTCLDKNASVLSSMPVYRTRGGKVVDPASWMLNPDPMVYSSWQEFAKQLFWDFQLGEVFIMEMSSFSDGLPMRFRVMPPWAFHVEMAGGGRRYRLGGITGPDVTEDILHIRYKSTSDGARGVGPLESAGGRMLTAGLIAKYVRELVATGGVPLRTIETDVELTEEDAQDLANQYMASRVQNASAPPIFDNGATLKDHPSVSPKDMAMIEIAQFNESRIAVLLGVPPFLVGLPAGGDSMTYSNVSALFDFHDRQTLKSLASHVMGALSYWALPRGQAAELNRDEYSRPSFDQRAVAWEKLITARVVTPEEVRMYERFQGEGPPKLPETPETPEQDGAAMTQLTGGEG
jgi:HK97 family phage portal protein